LHCVDQASKDKQTSIGLWSFTALIRQNEETVLNLGASGRKVFEAIAKEWNRGRGVGRQEIVKSKVKSAYELAKADLSLFLFLSLALTIAPSKSLAISLSFSKSLLGGES